MREYTTSSAPRITPTHSDGARCARWERSPLRHRASWTRCARPQSGSGGGQRETSKIARKLVGGQGLLSTRWAGCNSAAHLVKGGASSARHPMRRHPLWSHRVERAGGGHSDVRRWSVRCGTPVRWVRCARAVVRRLSARHRRRAHRRTAPSAPDAGVFRTPPPGEAHRVNRPNRSNVVSTPLRARVRGGIPRVRSPPAAAPRAAPRVRPAAGVLPGAVPGSGGIGDGDSAIRIRAASASCSRSSCCSGEKCGNFGATMGPPCLRRRSPAPSPAPGWLRGCAAGRVPAPGAATTSSVPPCGPHSIHGRGPWPLGPP